MGLDFPARRKPFQCIVSLRDRLWRPPVHSAGYREKLEGQVVVQPHHDRVIENAVLRAVVDPAAGVVLGQRRHLTAAEPERGLPLPRVAEPADLMQPSFVAEAAVQAMNDAESGRAWIVQPNRIEPYRFPGVPGPR